MSFFNPRNPFKECESAYGEVLERPNQELLREAPGKDDQWVPTVDILEDKTEYVFRADLPGLKKAEVKVFRERDTLYMTGERDLKLQGAWKTLRLESPRGYFVRRFALPDDANLGQIRAKLNEGVLEVHVRKCRSRNRETDYPQRLDVEIN